MATHELKCWPEPYAAILDGAKRHEVRKNDRGYAVGDVLHLCEWEPKCCDETRAPFGYTGREMYVRVTHLTPGGSWGLPPGICVMSIEPTTTLDRGNGPEPVLRSFVSDSYAAAIAPPPAAPVLAPNEREALEHVLGKLRPNDTAMNAPDHRECKTAARVIRALLAASPSQPVAPAAAGLTEAERRALAELERIRRELSSLAERLDGTFMGGYSSPRDLEIFRHGMGTAATCVEAVLQGERNQAPPLTAPRVEELLRQAEPRARETHRLGEEMRRPTPENLATVVRGRSRPATPPAGEPMTVAMEHDDQCESGTAAERETWTEYGNACACRARRQAALTLDEVKDALRDGAAERGFAERTQKRSPRR